MTNRTHMNMLHTDMAWIAPWLHEWWAHEHGLDMMGRLSRNNTLMSDIFTTFMAYTGMTQEEFNDDVFRASSKFVTWDLDRIRESHVPFANSMVSVFDHIGNGIYRVRGGAHAANRAPTNYGFNAVRLEVPTAGTEVTVDFMGRPDLIGTDVASVFRITDASRIQNAGWRYGFVAVTGDLALEDTRVYSDIFSAAYANPHTQGSFIVPDGATYLWLVVTGAPTEHWFGVRGSRYLDAWGYEISLTGTRLSSETYTHPRQTTPVRNVRITCPLGVHDFVVIDNGQGQLIDVCTCGFTQPHVCDLQFTEIPPTCHDHGYTFSGCRCGITNNVVILPALTCDWESVKTPPTCHDHGYIFYECTQCGDTKNREIVPALTCDWEFVIIPPIGDDHGYTFFECARCGDIRDRDVVPATSSWELFSAIIHAQSLTQSNYTRASWATMQISLSSARVVADDENASPAIIASTTAALWYAINNLVPIVATPPTINWDALDDAITDAQLREAIGQGSIPRAYWATFRNAIASAVSVRNNPDTTQSQANEAAAALRVAIGNLPS